MNKIQNRIVFKIETGYKLELLSLETMKLLGNTKNDIDQDTDGEDLPKLKFVEVVLMHCNLVDSNYLQKSKVLFIFLSNEQFCQLITVAPHSLTMLNTTNTEFLSFEV